MVSRPQPFNSKVRKSISSVSNYQPRLVGTEAVNVPRYPNSEQSRPALLLASKSVPASRSTSLISTKKGLKCQETVSGVGATRVRSKAGKPERHHPPLPSTTIVFDSRGRTVQQTQNDSKLITQLTSDRSWTAKESLRCPVVRSEKDQLPKIKTPCVPLSETKGSFKLIRTPSFVKSSERPVFPLVGNAAASGKVIGKRDRSHSVPNRQLVQDGGVPVINFINEKGQVGNGGKHESDKMKSSRSELSLLEQKKLQWAKEREELNGLWSPWGRQSEATEHTNSPTTPMQASYPSPTNVVSSSYMSTLGSSPYSQSYSECYLPPINSTIAQQPRQKAKVWNAEFQPEDYKYENDNASSSTHQNHRYSLSNVQRGSNGNMLQQRKASLPNYMYDSGENTSGLHQTKHHNKHNTIQDGSHHQNHLWGSSPLDEEAFTSGYYSENNNNTDDGKSSSCRKQEVILKPTSRERSYQEEVTIQKAIQVREGNNASPRVIVHKIYSQNGEMIMQHDENQEIMVNSMTISQDETNYKSAFNDNRQQRQVHQQDVSSRSPGGHLPRNHAMRSSLTIGVDARSVDAYNDIDRREKQQWLDELEKQREEQRLRKMMEKEERRPRWGDRGIGVGHFWEPSESENSHLPAPPQSTRGKHSSRGESHGDELEGGSGDAYTPTPYHPGHSHTPPAWLERSLTRMQSSKSQPSLHDPEYVHDLDTPHHGMSNENIQASKSNHQLLTSSRSLNHSTSDLAGYGYVSPTGDFQGDSRTYIRGQNVPIDHDMLTEREKKRQANQEHLEALKKQIEEKQQKQREEKELRLQEEREQEIRIAKQRELELQRLEREKRGKMPVNGDMPNCIEDTVAEPSDLGDCSHGHDQKTKNMHSVPIRDPGEEKDIAIVQRQNVLLTSLPTLDDDDKTTESSDAITHHHRPRLSRQDQSVMTDGSDPSFERTLTPSFQRSRSLSLSRSIREFGTQTELSDDKKAKEKKQEKKLEERPRWNSNPVKKQYVKQSEKDPNYVTRMKRRQERLKRMEEERSLKGDTGTESEDVSIPFHRIRQRRNEPSPQRRVSRGITPMKATALQKTESGSDRLATATSLENVEHPSHYHQIVDQTKRDKSKSRVITHRTQGTREDLDMPPCSHSHSIMKNAKSETHLSKESTAAILDRNFGSVAGIPVTSGTSEESSGFSTPFLPRRDLGSGSTGSGTTGSGSGIQSPDLTYHTYQANKSTREERKYAKTSSGRDSHFVVKESVVKTSSNNHASKSTMGTTTARVTTEKEFSSHKGFVHQRDFDEMPIKSAAAVQESSINDINGNSPSKKSEGIKTSSPKRGRPSVGNRNNAPVARQQQQRNKSMSPQRKPKSPVKGNSFEWKNSESRKHLTKSTSNINKPGEEINLPNIPQEIENRPISPPVPALLKKMQMGLQPDESGRISSLPTEFPDILAPLPTIPIGILSPNPSRLSSATSGTSSSRGKIDIDIAVTPRSNPEILKLFNAAEERIKQRQLSAIMAGNNGKLDNDSGKSRSSFEADIGRISINLEPVMLFPSEHLHGISGVDTTELGIPSSARLSIRSHPSPRPSPSPRDAAVHEAFITSILNSKEVKEQLSARESELSEKGIIEFSIRLPSTSSGDDFIDEYKDPLLTERRRNTAQWLYGGQNVPQKQAILTNLASLKKGIALQQQEWKVGPSDTE